MKIALVSMAPFIGGAEIAAERLAVALTDAGHELVVILGNRGAVFERFRRSGLRCLVSPICLTDKWHCWRYLSARSRLRRLLERERPDLVHSNDLPTHQIVSDVSRHLGLPTICHHRFPFDGVAIDWLNKFGADRHFFVSRALMDEMCACSPRLEASPRSVIHDGLPLPPEPTPSARLRARQRLGLAPDRGIVVYAGQFIERKGIADLISAWVLMDDSIRARSDLLLIGDDLQGRGEYRRAMVRLAEECACPAWFLGFRADVSEWLVAADVAVVPSHVEPLGNATLEAMAHGRPVVGCSVGGIPEMVVHQETGLLVPPRSPDLLASALARLLHDGAARQLFGDRGRKRCEELFSLKAHADSVLNGYAQISRGTERVEVA